MHIFKNAVNQSPNENRILIGRISKQNSNQNLAIGCWISSSIYSYLRFINIQYQLVPIYTYSIIKSCDVN
jgi:hypothetical protein